MVPSMPVPGNHEQAKQEDGSRRLTRHWRPQFTLPADGPPGLEETCYSFEYQDTLMVSLNSNEKLEEQARWLDQLLSQNKRRWVVCVFHHPVFSAAKERDNAPLRNAWKPLFDRYRVDLVLQGHDHSYTRSGLQIESNSPSLVTNQNVPSGINHVDAETGTIYVVSVSGPKMYPAMPQAKMQRVGDDLQLFQIIHIEGDTLSYEARTPTGVLYDAFLLRKRPDQPNLLLEKTPEMPEKRRPPVVPKVSRPRTSVLKNRRNNWFEGGLRASPPYCATGRLVARIENSGSQKSYQEIENFVLEKKPGE